MIKKLHHIGIAVSNLDATIKLYSKMLGKEPTSVGELPTGGVRMAGYKIGDFMLEFLEGTSGTSLERFIETKGEDIHHVAFEVDNIEDELKRQEGLGVKLKDREPRLGPDGEIAFIGPDGSHGVYIELVQPRKGDH